MPTSLNNQRMLDPHFCLSSCSCFQRDGSQLLYCHTTVIWNKPSAKERKRAMKFHWFVLYLGPHKADQDEAQFTIGQNDEINVLTWLLVICIIFQIYLASSMNETKRQAHDVLYGVKTRSIYHYSKLCTSC